MIDAGHSARQKELVATLSESGAEIILDTKAAEFATPVGVSSKAGQLPWANSDRPHSPSDWAGETGVEKAHRIAEFAIANRIDTVLSPAHLIQEIDAFCANSDNESQTHQKSRLRT